MQLSLTAPNTDDFALDLVLDDWEVWMVKKYVKYSIPMMTGWYGMYDNTFAKRHKTEESEDFSSHY